MNNEIISIEKVDIFQEKQKVFDNISLKINEGEFVYIIGKTGSGKSSLLKALYAEIEIKRGNLVVLNKIINKIKDKEIPLFRRNLGIVFQDFKLLYDRDVFHNLEFVLKATGWSKTKEIEKRIKEVLEKVHLCKSAKKMPYELSGGEKQRAAIARALLNHPKLVLADEPTGNLDPSKSEKIIELFKEINDSGTTVVIATHDYSIIKKNKSRTLKCEMQKIEEQSIESLYGI